MHGDIIRAEVPEHFDQATATAIRSGDKGWQHGYAESCQPCFLENITIIGTQRTIPAHARGSLLSVKGPVARLEVVVVNQTPMNGEILRHPWMVMLFWIRW